MMDASKFLSGATRQLDIRITSSICRRRHRSKGFVVVSGVVLFVVFVAVVIVVVFVVVVVVAIFVYSNSQRTVKRLRIIVVSSAVSVDKIDYQLVVSR